MFSKLKLVTDNLPQLNNVKFLSGAAAIVMTTIVLVQKILFSFFPFLVYVLSTRFPLAKKKLQQKISVLVFMAITEAIC